jgi:hypothetical protein
MPNQGRKAGPPAGPNLGRHARGCRICAHSQREEIERDFIAWKSPNHIAREYGLRDRATVYRHAHALDLFAKRSRNIRAALERIIEKVDDVQVNAGAVVQAITAYGRINTQGQLVERRADVRFNDLFERMSAEELEAYAKEGTLPDWFTRVAGATQLNGPEGGGNG